MACTESAVIGRLVSLDCWYRVVSLDVCNFHRGPGLGRSRPALACDYQAALGCAPSITGGWAVVTGIKWPVERFISSRWRGWK
jgi:hypothetical protein